MKLSLWLGIRYLYGSLPNSSRACERTNELRCIDTASVEATVPRPTGMATQHRIRFTCTRQTARPRNLCMEPCMRRWLRTRQAAWRRTRCRRGQSEPQPQPPRPAAPFRAQNAACSSAGSPRLPGRTRQRAPTRVRPRSPAPRRFVHEPARCVSAVAAMHGAHACVTAGTRPRCGTAARVPPGHQQAAARMFDGVYA